MNRRDINKVLGVAAIAPATLAMADRSKAASSWSLVANLAECCSCEIPCPCNFGRPTELRCDGNRLIEITEGHIDDMDLVGVRFLVTFEMGKWTRIYADDSMSEIQSNAFEAILPLGFAGFHRGAQTIESVPLVVERSEKMIRISTPDAEVRMKPLAGMDGGLIKVDGLPSNTFYDYIQYESVEHVYRGPGRQWSHSGTNGFTSRMIASG